MTHFFADFITDFINHQIFIKISSDSKSDFGETKFLQTQINIKPLGDPG